MTLRQRLEAIWKAGVSAVDSEALVRRAIRLDQGRLQILGETFPLERLCRIIVVGAGKAGAGMAAGVEQALGPDLVQSKVTGWVNVPLDCVRPLQRIHLHAARPPGVNEPTAQGVSGSEAILKLVASLTDHDLCLVLISGGGSALLPAPTDGISLEDKLAVTRCLMNSGATIQQLNTVRKRLSRIKGGGLLRAASAGRMLALIISDVPGDPLDIIASGPTVCDTGTAQDAIQVLEQIVGPSDDPNRKIPLSVWNALKEQSLKKTSISTETIPCRNCVIGNNRTAVDAAANYARSLGYEVRDLGSDRQGIAREMGIELAERCLDVRKHSFSTNVCFVAGGEPVVKLAETKRPRRGGRNQEFALAAGQRWWNDDIGGMALLSGGTDGEDGPTDAAGAIVDSQILKTARDLGLNPEPFLAINDSYTFFDRVGGLLKTGPTHTNVMDLQIALVAGVQK